MEPETLPQSILSGIVAVLLLVVAVLGGLLVQARGRLKRVGVVASQAKRELDTNRKREKLKVASTEEVDAELAKLLEKAQGRDPGSRGSGS